MQACFRLDEMASRTLIDGNLRASHDFARRDQHPMKGRHYSINPTLSGSRSAVCFPQPHPQAGPRGDSVEPRLGLSATPEGEVAGEAKLSASAAGAFPILGSEGRALPVSDDADDDADPHAS